MSASRRNHLLPYSSVGIEASDLETHLIANLLGHHEDLRTELSLKWIWTITNPGED